MGELKSEIRVTKNDYDPVSLSGAFSVVKASDSSPDEDSDNEDDNDDDIQYSIQGGFGGQRCIQFCFRWRLRL